MSLHTRLLRLLATIAAALVTFIAVTGAVKRATGHDDIAGGVGLLAALIVVPLMLRHVWPVDAGRRCPGRKGLYPECLHVVTLDATTLTVRAPDGVERSLALAAVREVAIITNDSGPVGADVWWELSGAMPEQVCRFPGGATGENAVLAFVQTLPDFDNEAFIRAMGSTANERFVCWRASGADLVPTSNV